MAKAKATDESRVTADADDLTTEDVEVLCEELVLVGLVERMPFDGDPSPRYRLTALGERYAATIGREPAKA